LLSKEKLHQKYRKPKPDDAGAIHPQDENEGRRGEWRVLPDLPLYLPLMLLET